MSRLILVAMMPPLGATLCDLLATTVENDATDGNIGPCSGALLAAAGGLDYGRPGDRLRVEPIIVQNDDREPREPGTMSMPGFPS
jgi:hypothetical protein